MLLRHGRCWIIKNVKTNLLFFRDITKPIFTISLDEDWIIMPLSCVMLPSGMPLYIVIMITLLCVCVCVCMCMSMGHVPDTNIFYSILLLNQIHDWIYHNHVIFATKVAKLDIVLAITWKLSIKISIIMEKSQHIDFNKDTTNESISMACSNVRL